MSYDDGDRETLSVAAVKPYDWVIGGRLECNCKGTGKWYPGKIASLGGETIGINYDDGDRETTKTGRCRSQWPRCLAMEKCLRRAYSASPPLSSGSRPNSP